MIIDHCDKTISIKIVYFGPALSGKTTSIKSLFSYFGKSEDVMSIESTVNRTLFFDYGTVTFQNQDWHLKLHIFTTTG
ncbi:MAG TPA: gliding motility protein, partial [bacterium]|nr:gliding motility protein [bacterium]